MCVWVLDWFGLFVWVVVEVGVDLWCYGVDHLFVGERVIVLAEV